MSLIKLAINLRPIIRKKRLVIGNTVIGAGIGAVGGAVSSKEHKGRNTLIGATTGGIIGGLNRARINYKIDKRKVEIYKRNLRNRDIDNIIFGIDKIKK